MAININDVKFLIDTISNKFQSGGWSVAEYNAAFAAVNYDFLKWRVGLPEAYQVGMPIAPINYQDTSKITDDVRFLITKSEISIDNSGYFPIPDDYFAFSSWRYKYTVNSGSCDEQPIVKETSLKILSDNELNEILDNTITPPTLTYPCGGYYSYGLKVYPEAINKVTCTYLRVPATPVWGYTMVNDVPVYNQATSTNFEYPVSCMTDIAILCMKYLGVNLRDADIVTFAQSRQKEGV